MDRTSETFAARAADIESSLAFFTGTENYYSNSVMPLLRYTDGIKWLAVNAECYWLLEVIHSRYPEAVAAIGADFQLWSLTVSERGLAVLECRADSDMPAVVRQTIGYTDFPLAQISLYVESGVLLLPREH